MPQALLSRQAFSWGLALASLATIALAPVSGRAAQRSPVTPQDLSAVHLVANARNPYGNVDRRNDAGNDTGDSEVERLNEGQLDQNYRGRNPYRPSVAPPAYPPPPGYAPPPGYPRGYPPPPGGAPPGYQPPGY